MLGFYMLVQLIQLFSAQEMPEGGTSIPNLCAPNKEGAFAR